MGEREVDTLVQEHLGHVMPIDSAMFDCTHCVDNPHRRRYPTRDSLWIHCLESHSQLLPARSDELLRFRKTYEEECQIWTRLKSTKSVPAVNGKPTPNEAIYAADDPHSISERIILHGGMALNGRPAELVRVNNDGTAVSLATGKQIKMESIGDDEKNGVMMKRSLSEELDDEEAIMRSMARRRKRSPTSEVVLNKCSEPGCSKEFKRLCDLTKHEKTHRRPWKCQEPLCKYHEYGWPTEKELDRHVNDKHSPSPRLFRCQFPPCSYQSKRESNCKQHMEKSHNWVYVRSKNNGRNQAPAQQQKALPTHSNFADLSRSSSYYSDWPRDIAAYQADNPKLTADYLRQQQHVEASSAHRSANLARWLISYDDVTGTEALYASFSSSDPALSQRRQSRSSAPKPNEPPSLASDQNNTDINPEVIAGHPASYSGADSDSSSNYGDALPTRYLVNTLGERVKITSDLPRKPQHVETTSSRPDSYVTSLDDSSGNYEGKLSDTTSCQTDIMGEPPKFTDKAAVDNVFVHGLNGPAYHTWTASNIMRKQQKAISSRRVNPYVSTLNTKPRENRRKVLRVRINDKDHLACPDSGSEKNIISKACALEHGFRIRSRKAKDIKRFEVGNGDIVWSIGRVSEIVGLPGCPLWKKKRWFYVLENCPVPLVMGMELLREAEILTKYRHLLENCPVEMSNISSLLWIGSPRNRFRCTIDGRQLEAVADTGSDLNLMSLACAEREGFRIDRREEARTQILVGNGKVIETLGQVYVSNITLDWREPEAESPEQSPRRPSNDVPLEPDPHGSEHRPQGEGDDDLYISFHVVENLPCDIIFGQKFLDDTDAFSKCPELLGIPSSRQNRQFEKHKKQFEFMVFRSRNCSWLSFSKKPKLAVDLREQHDSNWHFELYRRSKNTEDNIALLPPGEQEAARKTERKKVREWNTAHVGCKFCNTGSTT